MKKIIALSVFALLAACGPKNTVQVSTAEPISPAPAVSEPAASSNATQVMLADSFEEECARRLMPTRVEVVALPSKIEYNFQSTMADLTRKGTRQKELGQIVLGLTEATLHTNLSWNNNMLVSSEDGKTCMRPQLSLTFNVTPQVVSVAHEFPQGTCSFNEIATHEMRHVRANQAQLEKTADLLRQELSEFFGQKIFYGQKDTLKRDFEQALKTTWLAHAQAELDKVNGAHNAIDSPEEYERNKTVCNGAITKAIYAEGLLR